MKEINIAVVGATGAVGEAVVEILQERKFPVKNLYLLASERSVDQEISFKGEMLLVESLAEFDFSKVDLAFFAAGSLVSEAYAPKACDLGCIVIDKSSYFRYDPEIPLVIPEVNRDAIAEFSKRNIIASPNCSTVPMLVALKPIYDAVGIERINVATYQSVSGTGKRAIRELVDQTSALLNGKTAEHKVYPHPIAFNVLPQCDIFLENGYTKEEMKLLWETQKILHDPNITVNATAVRVPVIYGHSEALHIETRQKISALDARTLLKQAPGVMVFDEIAHNLYPTPMQHVIHDAVCVGRIREDLSHPFGLDLWVVADNVRKGGALNAVQIAEILIASYM